MNSHHMSKASLSCVFLLWIFVHVATMVRVAEGDTCSEGLGECGMDCQERCALKHPGGEGSCEKIGNILLCTCYYDCPPPPGPDPKICNGGAGVCSTSQCWNDCCNKNCATKYKEGTGFCEDLGGAVVLCQCQYPCN